MGCCFGSGSRDASEAVDEIKILTNCATNNKSEFLRILLRKMLHSVEGTAAESSKLKPIVKP